MTRQQIVKMTSETGSLVASNRAGVAPVNQKHVARFQVLKSNSAAHPTTPRDLFDAERL
jgi:hypothetical protein